MSNADQFLTPDDHDHHHHHSQLNYSSAAPSNSANIVCSSSTKTVEQEPINAVTNAATANHYVYSSSYAASPFRVQKTLSSQFEKSFLLKESFDININDEDSKIPLLQTLTKQELASFSSTGTLAAVGKMSVTSNKRVIFYALGIFVCYFYYGIFQEKITRTYFGPDRELFTCTLTLVLIQCIVNAIFAKAMMKTFLKQPRDTTTHRFYAACALTYLTAMVSSNMALQHVNYPTQVIGKSCKPIPVMILGVLIGRKSYSLFKYMLVLMIVFGVGIFMYKDNGTGGKSADAAIIGTGELFLILSLSMDGLTGAIQERMKGEYQTKSGHMMFNMNLWSILYLATASFGTNEISHFIEFIGKFPFILYYIFAFSVLSALGQMFIFLTVADFGPLPCSIITTTRKFFTVLASVLLFGNTLSNRQWFGTVLVFAGLTLDAVYSKKKK